MAEKKIPLRFWIGRHKDGDGRQCIVDTDGGPMEGVKSAWNEKNPQAVTTMETVIQPALSPDSEQLLNFLLSLEGCLGDPTNPMLHKLLKEVAMAAYEAGQQNAALRPKRP